MNQNQPPANPQSIYPDPDKQNPNPTKEIQKPRKDNTTKIILIVVGCVFGLILLIGITYAISLNKIYTARSQLLETKIKDCVQTNKQSTQNYFNQNHTYIGWIGNESCNSEIKKYTWSAGHTCTGSSCNPDLPTYISEIKAQSLATNNYVIYAYLPYSDMQYCTDTTGFIGEVLKIDPNQTACQ